MYRDPGDLGTGVPCLSLTHPQELSMFSYLTRRDLVFIAVPMASASALSGAWLGFVCHSQHMSLARHINSSK